MRNVRFASTAAIAFLLGGCGDTTSDLKISSTSVQRVSALGSASSSTAARDAGQGSAQASSSASASGGAASTASHPLDAWLQAQASAPATQASWASAGRAAQAWQGTPTPAQPQAGSSPGTAPSSPAASAAAPSGPPPTQNAASAPGAAAPASAYRCPSDATDPFAEARRACVAGINGYRATRSLPPLRRWCAATTCADGQAADDSSRQAAHSAFGRCRELAQNECPDWSAPPQDTIPDCLKMMWAEGPGADLQAHGHYTAMASNQYTEVECGFHVNGELYWSVQDFH